MRNCILNHIAGENQSVSARRHVDSEYVIDEEYLALVDSSGTPIITLELNPLKLNTQNGEIWVKDRYDKYSIIPVLLTQTRVSHHRMIKIEDDEDVKRCGWLIPLSSILEWDRVSQEYSSDMYLKKFVDVAVWSLLFDNQCFPFKQSSVDFEQDSLTLEEIYSPDIGIAVLYKDEIPDDMIENDNLVASAKGEIVTQLLLSGYSTNTSRNPRRFLAQYDWNTDRRRKHITIKRVSSDIKIYVDIMSAILNEAAAAENPVVAFFLLYQIVEEFLAISFRSSRDLIIEELSNVQGAYDYFGFVQALGDSPRNAMTNTPGIMRHLFDYYCKKFTKKKHTDLRSASKKFLEEISDIGPHSHTFAYTYTVRNMVMHSQVKWIRNERAFNLLSEVNRCLLQFISEMMSNLKTDDGKKQILKDWRNT
jgi:hypothetical protein